MDHKCCTPRNFQRTDGKPGESLHGYCRACLRDMAFYPGEGWSKYNSHRNHKRVVNGMLLTITQC